jgi:hypothetical protein
MSLAQYNGSNPGTYEDVYYAGTGTLTVGQVVSFALSTTVNPLFLPAGALTVPPTSTVLSRDLLGRQVTDVGSTNQYCVAGVVADLRGLPAGVGPGWIAIQKPIPGDVVDLYTLNTAITTSANSTILGLASTGGTNSVVSLGTGGTSAFSGLVLAIALSANGTSSSQGSTVVYNYTRAKFI